MESGLVQIAKSLSDVVENLQAGLGVGNKGASSVSSLHFRNLADLASVAAPFTTSTSF